MTERITADHPIWQEVDKQVYEDSMVANAAASPVVQEVIGLLTVCRFDDPSVEKDSKRALRNYVTRRYEVPPHRCEEVFSTAEEVMRLEGEVDG